MCVLCLFLLVHVTPPPKDLPNSVFRQLSCHIAAIKPEIRDSTESEIELERVESAITLQT